MLLSNWEESCAASRIREAVFLGGARMETTEKQEDKAPKACRECSRWNEMKERIRISILLEKAITGIEDRLTAKDFKPTMGDYLKLLQIEKELEQEETKEIKVTWVEPPVTSDFAK